MLDIISDLIEEHAATRCRVEGIKATINKNKFSSPVFPGSAVKLTLTLIIA